MAALSAYNVKLPRLRVKDELIRARPHLAELFGQQEQRAKAQGKALLRGSLLEDDGDEEELVRRELEAVKRERAHLVEQLAQVKTDQGKAGGDLQEEDIQILRREIELKKAKLNELYEAVLLKEKDAARMALISRDCSRLMPDGSPEAAARLAELHAERAAVELERAEALAKHRLYELLEARTKREVAAVAAAVAEAQQLQREYEADANTLRLHVWGAKAALEEALKERQRGNKLLEVTREDWARKLRDRHNEVRELQKLQQEEAEREKDRLQALAAKEAAERERATQLRLQEEALAQQLQAVQPQLEALEEAWARLHSITGAEDPESLIAHWKGLKVQESSMHELAAMAEAREADARAQIRALLDARCKLLEEGGDAQSMPKQGGLEVGTADVAVTTQLEVAERRAVVAKKHFAQLRDVCIAAQQGLQAITLRLDGAVSKLEGKAANQEATTSKPRRTSSLSRARASEGHRAADSSAGMKLMRMYTIDQDQFFPDLPALIQAATDKMVRLRALMGDLDKSGSGDCSLQSVQTVRVVPRESLRRRTWTGAPWLLKPSQAQVADAASASNRRTGDGRVDLTRLVGYNDPRAAPAAVEEEVVGENVEWDGVVTRKLIKNRAAKLLQRQKAQAAAQATQKT